MRGSGNGSGGGRGVGPGGGAAGAFGFDDQAVAFDRRTGLSATVAQGIARTIVELAELERGDLLVEQGAGTGEIGVELAARGVRYLGLDVSRPMLAVFAERLAERAAAAPETRAGLAGIAQADADRPWPLAAGRARALVFSRSAHLLDRDHVVREAERVADPRGAMLLVGRVRRDPDSVRSRMRARMRELLAERAGEGRDGRRAEAALVAALEARGARRLPERVAASWTVREAPAGPLAAWRGKTGLAGRALADAVRIDLLDDLEAWARERFGDLLAEQESEEHYELSGVRLS